MDPSLLGSVWHSAMSRHSRISSADVSYSSSSLGVLNLKVQENKTLKKKKATSQLWSRQIELWSF